MKIHIHLLRYLLIMLASVFTASTHTGQSLDSLKQLVVKNNPELHALSLEYEAALTKIDQVGQLPNPEMGLGFPLPGAETRLGPQELMVSASQMFPWFGTLKAQKEVEIAMSKAKFERISTLKLDLFYELKTNYYQLYSLQQKEEILNEYLVIYEALERVALAKVASGKATIADVLRVQMGMDNFVKDIQIVNNSRNTYLAKINELTNRNFSSNIIITDSLEALAPLDYNLELLQENVGNKHPSLTQLDYEIVASQNIQVTNTNSGRPALGLGLDYTTVDKRTDANPMNNGQDIFVPKVKLSIPLYRKQYRAKNQEEQLNQAALALEKQQKWNAITSNIITEKTNYDNAAFEIVFNKKQIITTEQVYDILLAQYSSTGEGFDELLRIQNQLLDYKLKLLQAQIQSYIARANIIRATNF